MYPTTFSTACGDVLLKGFWGKPTKDSINVVKRRSNLSTKEQLDKGEGRFIYAVLGPYNVRDGWDKVLEDEGFKCVRKILNSAHHYGEPMKFYLKIG